jgi:hypothetical protein
MAVTKRSMADLILSVLQCLPSQYPGVPYNNLYEVVCPLWGHKPSRRDFQKALDTLRKDALIVVEEDPKDRRRKLIHQAPPTDSSSYDHDQPYEDALATRLKTFLVETLTKEPWLAPIKIPLSLGDPDDDWPHDSPKELIQQYQWWQGFSEQEAREVISTYKAIWKPIQKRFRAKPDAQEAKALDAIKLIAEANAQEMIDAWKERRSINRARLIQIIRQRLKTLG